MYPAEQRYQRFRPVHGRRRSKTRQVKLGLVKGSEAPLSDDSLVSKSAIGEKYRPAALFNRNTLAEQMSNLEWSQCDARPIRDLPDLRTGAAAKGKRKKIATLLCKTHIAKKCKRTASGVVFTPGSRDKNE